VGHREDAVTTNYTTMSGAEFQREVGDDVEKWADAAMQDAEREGYAVDRDWLLKWLSDAMDAARKAKPPPVIP
jgi:hypothetical protein